MDVISMPVSARPDRAESDRAESDRCEWVSLDLGSDLRVGPLAVEIDGDHLVMVAPCSDVVSAVLLDHAHEAAAVAWLERPRAEVVALTGWLSRVPSGEARPMLDRTSASHPTRGRLVAGQDHEVLRLRVRGALCSTDGLVQALDLLTVVPGCGHY